jgi:hypothetical protein
MLDIVGERCRDRSDRLDQHRANAASADVPACSNSPYLYRSAVERLLQQAEAFKASFQTLRKSAANYLALVKLAAAATRPP